MLMDACTLSSNIYLSIIFNANWHCDSHLDNCAHLRQQDKAGSISKIIEHFRAYSFPIYIYFGAIQYSGITILPLDSLLDII